MNKGQLIGEVARELGTSRAEAARAVDSVLCSIAAGLKRDASVTISGFGSFSRRTRAARTMCNPNTGAPMQVDASMTVGFRASPALKKRL